MIIRSASFRDLARIEQLYREATEDERHGAQMTPDSPVPQQTLLRLWQALTKSLSSLVPITDVSEEMLVAEDAKEGVVGFVQVQSLSVRPRSWQILNLCASTTAHGHFARADNHDVVSGAGIKIHGSRARFAVHGHCGTRRRGLDAGRDLLDYCRLSGLRLGAISDVSKNDGCSGKHQNSQDNRNIER